MIRLPFPVSTNSIWRAVKGKTTKSSAYRTWQKNAGWWLQTQQWEELPADTPYHLDITLDRGLTAKGKPRKARPDIDNCAKAILDLLAAHKVTPDDRLCQSLTMRWSDAQDGPTVKVKAGG